MSGHHPDGEDATVERQLGFDDDGVPIGSSQHVIHGCARDQTSTLNTIDGQQVVITRERILCDEWDADVQPTDLLTLADGSTWRVSGDIDRPSSPFDGWSPGCVIPVERASDANPPQPARE